MNENNLNEIAIKIDISKYLNKYLINYDTFIKYIYEKLKKHSELLIELTNNSVILETFINLEPLLKDELIEYLYNIIKTYERDQVSSRLCLIQLLYTISKKLDKNESNKLLRECIEKYFCENDEYKFKLWFENNIVTGYQLDFFK